MKIGEKIKSLRETRGMSLTALSKASGVALATLSRMEHNKMVGTLDSHLNIAKALGIDLPQLYSEVAQETKSSPLSLKEEDKNVFVHNEKTTVEILTSQIFSRKMLPALIKLDAGGKTTAEQGSAATEKFVYVLEGKINLYITNIKYPLNKGESLYFDGSSIHHFENNGKTAARVLCISTPPSL